MSTSQLVTYTKLSPNCTKAKRGTNVYIIPHCIVGQWTAKQGCDFFANPNRGASANYVVGKDGSIGLSVPENQRAWTTGGTDSRGQPIRVNGISGADADHYGVTIEVASDVFAPFAVTDAAYEALIRLVADIARRNGIKELRWRGDKSLVGHPEQQNLLVHRWFAYKSCPGDYLYERMGDIAARANKLLKGEDDDMTAEEVRKIVKETMAEELKVAVKAALDEANPVYKELKDVPPYWQNAAASLLAAGVVNGGTPAEVNDKDLNLRMETLKAAVIAAMYTNVMLPGGDPDQD